MTKQLKTTEQRNATYKEWLVGKFIIFGSIFNLFPRWIWFALASLYFASKYLGGESPFVLTVGFVVIFVFTSLVWYGFARLLSKAKI